MDNLLTIAIEAAHRASLVPFASEATIYAMKSFGTSPMWLPVIAAIAGGLFGHCVTLLIGRGLMRLPSNPKHHALFQRLETYANTFGFLLLVLAPLALGNILVLAAGMLGVPWKKSLPVTAAGLAFYYGQLLI